MPLFSFSRELGIDLGTMNTVIAEGNQILLQEPTVVAIVVNEQKMVETGQQARDMMARVSDNIQVIRPLPHGVTSVESRAVHEAGLGSSSQVLMIPQPLAAALGIDLPIGTPSGNMIL